MEKMLNFVQTAPHSWSHTCSLKPHLPTLQKKSLPHVFTLVFAL